MGSKFKDTRATMGLVWGGCSSLYNMLADAASQLTVSTSKNEFQKTLATPNIRSKKKRFGKTHHIL